MSIAKRRFDELCRKFRSQVRSRKKLSATQRHHILHAASLQQIAEVTVVEMVLGIPHDHGTVERLQNEIRHLCLS